MYTAVDTNIVIIPPTPGACRYCGDQHDPREPHNLRSLQYQHKFRKQNGRYPTWEDAMAHCSMLVKVRFTEMLVRSGVRIVREGQEKET